MFKMDKDPNKPKRPLSSFFLWLNANREQIKGDFPELSISETAKKAGELWKELKDKSEWDKKAEEAKEAYKIAMAEYKKNTTKKSNESGDDEDKKASKKFKFQNMNQRAASAIPRQKKRQQQPDLQSKEPATLSRAGRYLKRKHMQSSEQGELLTKKVKRATRGTK